MEIDKGLLTDFIDWARENDYAVEVFNSTEQAIEMFKQYKIDLEDKELSVPIITLEVMENWTPEEAGGCTTVWLSITHQVRFNGVDFGLDFVVDNETYFAEIDDPTLDLIYDRIHGPVTEGEMCSLEGKYLKSLFSPEVLEKYKFVKRKHYKKPDRKIGDPWSYTYEQEASFEGNWACFEGTDS
jgi:hypothetical protein